MVESPTIQFSELARATSGQARALGLKSPVFRSPPRMLGVTRTVRRSGERAVVSVAYKHRPVMSVIADLIEGVVIVNELDGVAACRARDDLWEGLGIEARKAA